MVTIALTTETILELILAMAFILLLILLAYIYHLSGIISKIKQEPVKKEDTAQRQELAQPQQDIFAMADKIIDELSKAKLTGQEISHIGHHIAIFGQFIYNFKGVEELNKTKPKKKEKPR